LARGGGFASITTRQRQEPYEVLIGGSNLTALLHLEPEQFILAERGLTISPK
jgi:hypothetical protein